MENRSWSELQPDILSLIHSRLFAGDLAIFNMICRSWQSTTLRFRVLPPPIVSSLFHDFPCLLTLYDTICQVYHPANNVTYKLDTPELTGARICSSYNGWLLVSKGVSNSFFFNPFIKEKINLPDTSWEALNSNISFSSPPSSPDCFVIGMQPCNSYAFTGFMTIKYGESDWTYQDPDNGFHKNGLPKKFLMCDYCSPVFLDGKWYFLGETGNFGVYDVKENSWDVCGKAWSARKRVLFRPSSLVVEKDGGGLLAVFLTHEHRHVHLKRFDLSKMMWEDIESLGNDKMLYVSEGASFLETSIARGMGNKIYFSEFDRENIGVFYCLSTKKYRSFDGKYCNKSPFKLVERRSSIWIKPVYTTADVAVKWC